MDIDAFRERRRYHADAPARLAELQQLRETHRDQWQIWHTEANTGGGGFHAVPADPRANQVRLDADTAAELDAMLTEHGPPAG